RDHRARDRAPGIHVKITGRAVEALSGFLKHQMSIDCNIRVRDRSGSLSRAARQGEQRKAGHYVCNGPQRGHMKPSRVVLLASVAMGTLVLAPTVSRPLQGQARVQDEMVTMRDGTKLAVSIYLPAGNGPWPSVLTRTPYGKDAGDPAKNEALYVDNGYVRVLQDSRGKGKSEGTYRPFADDVEDGYDTIEWMAKQPWSNGKVGMSGTSAMAIAT